MTSQNSIAFSNYDFKNSTTNSAMHARSVRPYPSLKNKLNVNHTTLIPDTFTFPAIMYH